MFLYWLRVHYHVMDPATTCVRCRSYYQIFMIIYNFWCLLLGFDELVGCARCVVYFVAADGDPIYCLWLCSFVVGMLELVFLGQYYLLASVVVGLFEMVLLGQHYVLSLFVV